MNDEKIKGAVQKAGGHLEEAAGALVGDHDLKQAGREDQIKGSAHEAWGNVKDAGNALVDHAKAATSEPGTSARDDAFDRDRTLETDRI